MINDLHINEYSEVSVFIHNGQYFCPQVIEYEYMQSSQHSYFSTGQWDFVNLHGSSGQNNYSSRGSL